MDTDIRIGSIFAQDVLAGAVEKKLSGGYEIRGDTLIFTCMWVFQKGAILGRVKAKNIKTLAKLVVSEDKQEEMHTFFKDIGQRMLQDYGGIPNSFLEFLTNTHFLGNKLDLGDTRLLKSLHETKIRLGEGLDRFQNAVCVGIGFGAFQPDLVKSMWIHDYETEHDPKSWADARRHGLDIPEKQKHITLVDIEKEVLQDVSEYVHEYRPDLIDEFGTLV